MLAEHPLSCAGIEGCSALSRHSHNLRMLVDHPLSLYHPWYGASSCSCEQMLTEFLDARRVSAILVGVEGCIIVSRQLWNRLVDARRASAIVCRR
jgi:hypothetical protein